MTTLPAPPPQEPPVQGLPTRVRRRRKRLVVTLCVLLLVVLALLGYGAGVYLWAEGKVRTVPALPGGPRPAAGSGTNWLLVGSDSRDSLSPGQREALHVGGEHGRNTDTLMILHHGRSGPYLISLPRDSYVEVPGHGSMKINAAYSLGGPKLLTRTVEQSTRLRIDHYAEISFLGLVEVVDELDGVRLCVPGGGLHDSRSGADFPGGCQEMDGTQALAYARARYSDPRGDLGRVRRQRQLVDSVAGEALSWRMAVSPWRQVPFLRSVLGALRVDEDSSIDELARMALATRSLSNGEGATATVPVAGQTSLMGAGDVVLWDEAGARRLFGAVRADRPLPGAASASGPGSTRRSPATAVPISCALMSSDTRNSTAATPNSPSRC